MPHPHNRSGRRGRLAVGAAALAALGLAGLGVGGLGLAAGMPRVDTVSIDDAEVYVSLSPVRVLDTRDLGGVPFGAEESRTLNLSAHIPPEATAAVINTTVDRATGPTFLTIWPTGEPRPYTSVNNPEEGIITPNTWIARLGADTSIDIYNDREQVDVVIDLAGYFVPVAEVEGFPGGDGPPAVEGSGTAATVGDGGSFVLADTTYATVASFTAPGDGSYLLDASVGVQFDPSETVSAGASATAVCRWLDGRNVERGAGVTQGIEIGGVEVPGVNRSNISVPGVLDEVTAGVTVDLQCRTETLLAVGSQLEVDIVYTAIQVASID